MSTIVPESVLNGWYRVERTVVIIFYSGILALAGVGCSWMDLEIPGCSDARDFGGGAASDEDAEGTRAEDVRPIAESDADEPDALDSSDSDTPDGELEDGDIDDVVPDALQDARTVYDLTQCEASGCDAYLVGGPSADFNTVSSAVNEISNEEIKRCAVFCIVPGEYDEQVTIPKLEGASEDRAVIFRGMGEDPTKIIIRYAPSSSENDWVVKLDGASHISLENMTLQSEGRNFGSVLVLSNGASYNTIRNSAFTSIYTATPGLVQVLDANTDNAFVSNRFEGGGIGIRFWSQDWDVSGARIVDNEFVDQINNAIKVQRAYGVAIERNRISADNAAEGYRAIYVGNCGSGWIVNGNTVITNTGRGLSVEYCTGSSELPNQVVNNFVRVQGKTGAAYNIAFELRNSDNLSIFYNSFVVGSRAGPNGVAFALSSTAAGSSSCIAKNNIFANFSQGLAIRFDNDEGLTDCDYNALYTRGLLLGAHGASRVTSVNLTSWKSALDIDRNSVSVDPLFISETDWHCSAGRLNGAGTPLSSVDIDLEGDSRDGKHPDIGADEFE